MGDSDGELKATIARYRQLVDDYERLDAQIDALIMRYGGTSDKMPAAALEQYRALARQRAEALNEMRVLEQELMDDGG